MNWRYSFAHLALASLIVLCLTPLMVGTDPPAQIAFVSDRKGNFKICVMGADGRNRRNFTKSRHLDWQPSWSPDGKRIAFVSKRNGNHEIYVMDADGKNQRRFTKNPHANNTAPAWSPDGERIAFASNINGNFEIYVMGADGRNRRNFTKSRQDNFSPAWFDPAYAVYSRPSHGPAPGSSEILLDR